MRVTKTGSCLVRLPEICRKHHSVFSSPAVMAGGSLYGGWGMLLHPTASLFTASRFQPLKKALYPNKEAKSTLYPNKEPFYAGRARDRGEDP